MFKNNLLLSLLFLFTFQAVQAQNPQLTDPELSIRSVAETPFAAVKLSHNPSDGSLYLITQDGNVVRVDIESGNTTTLQTIDDHSLEDVQGLDISSEGDFYIVGNVQNEQDATNSSYLKKGIPDEDGNWEWVTVAEMAPYPLSNTDFDHIMNEVVLSPDDKYAYINSGSRTDHGEEQAVWGEGYPEEGLYPGMREVPLTAKILRIPTDSTALYLENDIDFLKSNGFIYAEGTRNSFGLNFDGEGRLFSADNAGERDDPGEFNWLQEGKHYGFPWRIGGNDTPMQFDDYDPSEDMLLSTDSRSEIFYNDPDYPAPPEDIEFIEPILNYGPDGVNYKDANTGEVFDAAEQDTAISSFTGHRSSLGLVFDSDSALIGDYTGDGFVMAFTGGNDRAFLLQHMNDPGEDLLHLELTASGDTFTMQSTRIAQGFLNPIDSEIIQNKIYVLEFSNSWLNNPSPWDDVRETQIWEITFPQNSTNSEQDDVEIANKFELGQNYPNPFNPSTMISYKLPVSSEVSLKVFDMVGREVQELINGYQTAGSHQVEFNAENLPSGMYIYRLQTGSVELTRKMMLVK